MQKRVIKSLALCALMACLCMGCAGNEDTAKEVVVETTQVETKNEVEESTQILQTEEVIEKPKPQEVYADMIEESLLSVGNNGRLDVVLEKLSQGEEVLIAAIGGSITEGAGASKQEECYVSRFVDGLRTRYPEAEIRIVNAGIGGTPSTLGVMRYERDVTEVLGQNPDLVLVEFAVNDYQEPTGARAYESLVYTILEKEENPAVMLVFSVFKSKWNMQDIYIPIGEQYGLPMVSIKDAIAVGYEKGTLADGLFFTDEYHPTSYGHRIMADSLLYLIDEKSKKLNTELTECTTKQVYGADFAGIHFLTSASEACVDTEDTVRASVKAGGFDARDEWLQRTPHMDTVTFPDNWMHTADSSDKPFKVNLECKNILLSFKASNSKEFGNADVYIDGEYITKLEGYQPGGWNNSNIVMLLDEDKVSEHELEIRMTEGDEDKCFTIQCIGYTACDAPKEPGLKDVYTNNFEIGVALPNGVLEQSDKYEKEILGNYTRITCENEMKPDALLDRNACQNGLPETYCEPVVNFERCQPAINYALENDLKIRFHTLVWHSQTPKWFFTEDYTENGALVSKEVMLARMDSYIKTVLTYFDEEHPGLIYAVDVVNESFDVGNGDEYGVRMKDNLWYETVGQEYYYHAFVFARKYAPDYMKLYYNDYGCADKVDLILENLAPLKAEGLIDGIGMQSHLSTSDNIQYKFMMAVKAFCNAGYEVQATELDIGVKEQTEGAFLTQARKYRVFFEQMKKLQEEGYPITGITLWGISDGHTWRSDEYPLLYDKDMKEKPAYFGAMLDKTIAPVE
ncbi:MAG: hypothetical protein E7290_09260 [Lachnospiraceae bacterium]|nr:hypothetical protein [Lachnospiraceae bacterium]